MFCRVSVYNYRSLLVCKMFLCPPNIFKKRLLFTPRQNEWIDFYGRNQGVHFTWSWAYAWFHSRVRSRPNIKTCVLPRGQGNWLICFIRKSHVTQYTIAWILEGGQLHAEVGHSGIWVSGKTWKCCLWKWGVVDNQWWKVGPWHWSLIETFGGKC